MATTLAAVIRGEVEESIHAGDLVAVNSEGRILYSCGDSQRITYMRSAAKPLQLIPLLRKGAHEDFGFNSRELAVMAASHSGEAEHVSLVKSILEKIGLDSSYLQCGVHPPLHRGSRKALYQAGKKPNALHCNCSGKHSGMLALVRQMGWQLENYLEHESPLQHLIRSTVLELTSLCSEEMQLGIDGCGAPVFALTMERMALAYARLATRQEEAISTVVSSMMEHPMLVAGSDRFNTALMRALPGSILAKSGAEGIFCFALFSPPMGVAVKISDGRARALPPVVLRFLREIGLLEEGENEHLQEYWEPDLRNNHQKKVGKIKALFTLFAGEEARD